MNNGFTDVRAVREATDIVALIGAELPLKKHGADYHACCPFHDEKTPSFTVSPVKQFYHCFGCGAHGDVFDWLKERHGLTFRQSLEELAGRAGIELQKTRDTLLPGTARDAINAAMRDEIERAAALELGVLYQAISPRVAHRGIPRPVKDRYPHIQAPPDEHFEREMIAAQRLAKALYALYGVHA